LSDHYEFSRHGGVLPDKRTGLSVTSCPVFVRCHCPEGNNFSNIYNIYKTPCQSRPYRLQYACYICTTLFQSIYASFEAFMAAVFQVEFFWVVKPCNIAVVYRRFRGTSWLLLQ